MKARPAWLIAFLLVSLPILFAGRVVIAQTAATSTSLSSDSPTLMLPGSLTFTSVVTSNPPAAGVPSGTVKFFYDGAAPLGTAALHIQPDSQSFSGLPPFLAGTNPYTMTSAALFNAAHPDLVIADSGASAAAVSTGPVLLVYPGLGQGLFDTANFQTYPINSTPALDYTDIVDAEAVGSFSAVGAVDVVAHTYSFSAPSTYSILSKQANGTLAANVVVSYSIGTSAPDNQQIVASDFDGDGLSDIGYVNSTASLFGVSLNNAATPGTLSAPSQWTIAPVTVPGSDVPQDLCPTSIAAGKFTASGNNDLIVTATQCAAGSASQGFVVLFAGDGAGGFGATSQGTLGIQVTPLTYLPVGINPVAIAAGDFNKDGKLDVAVADSSDSTIKVLYGNGDGTFQATIGSFSTLGTPISLSIGDFNGDGFPDVAAALDTTGSVTVLLNDGKGNFIVPAQPLNAPSTTTFGSPVSVVNGDFNTDGVADLAVLTPFIESTTSFSPSVTVFLTSGSAQAVLTTAPRTLPAGIHTVTATFAGDANFATSDSAGVTETVTQTTPGLNWPAPATIVYGTPLSGAQLNAVATVPGGFTYTPPAGSVLPPGQATLSLAFTPTDTFDYTLASATRSITVTAPSLSGILPARAALGDPDTTLIVSGQGFVTGAVVYLDSTALQTTFVSLTQLTAVVPSAMLRTPGSFTITVADSNAVPVSGTQIFTVVAPAAVITATGPATINVGQQSAVTLVLSPYPVPVTATATLTFVPAPPNTVFDPTILFSNGSTTFPVDIPAGNTTAIPPINFQSGSTAGTITITVRLTAGGVDITPATLTPIVIAVPATPPGISAVTLTRSGKTLQLAITGLSSTREVSQAQFHFVAVPGQTLTTTDVTVPLTSAFSAWYQSEGSTAFGTQFLYTQPFTLDADASVIASVTVTLTNSQGVSAPANAQ